MVFFFFLIIDLYFLILLMIFNPTANLIIPTGIPTKEAKSDIETHTVTPEDKSK